MKKFIILIISILLFTNCCVYAKSEKNNMPSLKMNGKRFTLYYSAKSTEIKGYINEYYKKNEGYTTWTELIGLHHYPNAFYPIEHARDFQAFLDESGIPNELEINEKDNSAVLDFVIINSNKLPIIMEFNVFKYVKSPVCGSLGLQYAKRYLIDNALEVNQAKKEFKKTRRKYIKRVKKLEVPALVTTDADKGIYLTPPEPADNTKTDSNEPTEKEEIIPAQNNSDTNDPEVQNTESEEIVPADTETLPEQEIQNDENTED